MRVCTVAVNVSARAGGGERCLYRGVEGCCSQGLIWKPYSQALVPRSHGLGPGWVFGYSSRGEIGSLLSPPLTPPPPDCVKAAEIHGRRGEAHAGGNSIITWRAAMGRHKQW